jgi:DNA-binding transcriptional regulator LsrR (DeoR family)
MSQAAAILELFRERLGEVHLSSVNTLGLHESLTFSAIQAFGEIANLIPQDVPIILESPVSREQIEDEAAVAEMLLSASHLNSAIAGASGTLTRQ